MKTLLLLLLILHTLSSCQSRDNTQVLSHDSLSLITVAVSDSSLNAYYLNSYRKKSIPISIKAMSSLKPYRKDYYHTDYSEGKFTLKDTLYIFSEIKGYTGSTSRVNLNIPSEGVRAHYFLIKIQDKWAIVKDSTNMYET